MSQSYWKTWELDKIEEAIEVLDPLFYEGQDTIFDGRSVSNTDYDLMRKWLEKQRPISKIFEKVTNNKVSPDAGLVKHFPPFTSLNKINSEVEAEKAKAIQEWLIERQKDLGWDDFEILNQVQNRFVQAYKLDGIALRLYYERGKLIKAGLRPQDGIHGEDVTANVKYVHGIPDYLPGYHTLAISGEVICNISAFKEVNELLIAKGEKPRANPRNHAAGSIRHFKNPEETRKGKLRFVGYNIENFVGKPPYRDEVERAKWCNQVLKVPFVQVRPFRVSDLKEMEENVPNLDYEVDGIVISVRNLEEQEQCGRYGNSEVSNPKGKIAWKFKEQYADVEVKGILYQTGRTGRVVPVLIFEPVPLAGTMVKKATAHNYGYLERNEIGIGTIVRIIKSGKIIPKVIAVVSNKKRFYFLKNCLACSKPLTIVSGSKDNKDAVCENPSCPAKNMRNLQHYLDTFGVKGIGKAIIEELVDTGIVAEIIHFYEIQESDFVDTILSEREALLVLADIHMIANSTKYDNDELRIRLNVAKQLKKTIKAGKFLAALGIPNVGEDTGKVLIDNFKSLAVLMNATFDELTAISGVGERIAQSVVEFFKDEKENVLKLLNHVELELPKQGKLSGKIFVLSGTLPKGKEYYQTKIEDAGGIVKGSVGSSVNYLVAGEGSGTKTAKATELKVPIIEADELEKMF